MRATSEARPSNASRPGDRRRAGSTNRPRWGKVPAIVNDARFLIQVFKGLIRGHHARRPLMFWTVLSVLVFLFAGVTFFWSWLRAHPFFFLGYFGLCAWLTVLSALLAIYDLIVVRQEARRLRRQLEQDFLNEKEAGSSHDSHTT